MLKRLIGFIFMVGVLSAHASTVSRAESQKPLVVILMGPPGAGKGTHAVPLSAHLGIPHISTGDLFRENIRVQSPLGKQAKEYIDKGHLVPDELVLGMLFDRVAREDCKSGYILDGFPRTIPQAKELDQRLIHKVQLVVLNLNLPDAQIVERITGRLACADCGKPYHKTFGPPKTAGVCDVCSSALQQRDDDKEEVIRKRLEVYRSQTAPLIDYYAQQGVLKEIDSQNEKLQVFGDCLEAVPLIHAATR